MLDEIDKLGTDFRGDPAAALLEVLDPEQNNAFSRPLPECPTTSRRCSSSRRRTSSTPSRRPLRDRMEVIELPGYTEEEKLHIARRFLIPRQMTDARPDRQHASRSTTTLLRRIIREYTYEAGVRNLEREIGAVMRQVARRVAEGRRAQGARHGAARPAYPGPAETLPDGG